jgi:hypothetical protein
MPYFKETQIFYTDFRKISICQNFMKIRLMRAEDFHADRRTDMMKVSRFSQFCERAIKSEIITDRNHKMTKIPSAFSHKNVLQ